MMNVGLYIPVNIRKIKKAIWLEQVHMVGNMCHLKTYFKFPTNQKRGTFHYHCHVRNFAIHHLSSTKTPGDSTTMGDTSSDVIHL